MGWDSQGPGWDGHRTVWDSCRMIMEHWDCAQWSWDSHKTGILSIKRVNTGTLKLILDTITALKRRQHVVCKWHLNTFTYGLHILHILHTLNTHVYTYDT